MWKDQRGFGWISIIIIVVIIGFVGVGAYFFGRGGIGFGGGKGDNDGDGNTVEVLEEAEEITPVTEDMEYLRVSVSGNEYLYQNSKVSLEELISKLTEPSMDIPVKIMDENASRVAYTSLIEALKENNIRYIE